MNAGYQNNAHRLVDLYLWDVLNLCILERFWDDITDNIVNYPFGTTSQPAIASTSNLTRLAVSAIMWLSMGAKLYFNIIF